MSKKEKNTTKKTIQILWKLLKFMFDAGGKPLVLYMIFIVIGAIFPIIGAWLFARFLDSAVISVNAGYITKSAILFGVGYAIMQFLNNLIGEYGLINDYLFLLFKRNFWKQFLIYRDQKLARVRYGVLEMPEIAKEFRFLERYLSADRLVRILRILLQFLVVLISLIFVGFILAIKMPFIFLLGGILGFADAWLAYKYTRESINMDKAFTNVWRIVNRSFYAIGSYVSLLRAKALGLVKYLIKRYGKEWFVDEEIYLTRAEKWNLRIYPLKELYGLVLNTIIMIYLLLKAVTKVISFGDISYFSSLSGQLRSYVYRAGKLYSDLSESIYYLDRFFIFWEQTLPEYERKYKTGTVVPVKLKEKDFVVKDLNFKYKSGHKLVLDHINLRIPAKSNIAIVGHNGAGKSTFLKLLLGHYINYEGSLKLGNHEVKDFDYLQYLASFSIVSQEVVKFEFATLLEAITIDKDKRKFVNRPIEFNDYDGFLLFKNKKELHDLVAKAEKGVYDDAYQEFFIKKKKAGKIENKVWDILKTVGLYDFVKELPYGLNTYLSPDFLSGTDLSMGQWQRLHIARILYAPGDILILDEPTSAIDPMASFKLVDTIFDTFRDRTVIIVSHRYSTIAKADLIYVFDKGQVVESGTHKELVAKNGVYAKAYKEEMKRLGEGS